MFQFCGDVESVGFSVQDVYKMMYGDENATFEPVNGYEFLILTSRTNQKGVKQMKQCRRLILLVTFWGVMLAAGQLAFASQAASEIVLSKGQAVYVPIYSHVFGGDTELPFYLTATLSIRNTDPNSPITILSVNYYDSKGKLVRRYLKHPKKLNPMASSHHVVEESNKRGGLGANFIVKWKSETKVNEPVIEGVMIGTKSQQGISFISRGRPIREKTDSK